MWQVKIGEQSLCKFRITESGAKENSVQVNLTDQAKGWAAKKTINLENSGKGRVNTEEESEMFCESFEAIYNQIDVKEYYCMTYCRKSSSNVLWIFYLDTSFSLFWSTLEVSIFR